MFHRLFRSNKVDMGRVAASDAHDGTQPTAKKRNFGLAEYRPNHSCHKATSLPLRVGRMPSTDMRSGRCDLYKKLFAGKDLLPLADCTCETSVQCTPHSIKNRKAVRDEPRRRRKLFRCALCGSGFDALNGWRFHQESSHPSHDAEEQIPELRKSKQTKKQRSELRRKEARALRLTE